MFEETLQKFLLVFVLFVVFVILGNLFAARQHAASTRAATIRRRGRRRAISSSPQRPQPPTSEPTEADLPELDAVEDQKAQIRRKLGPQIILSVIAVGLGGLAVYVMWLVSKAA